MSDTVVAAPPALIQLTDVDKSFGDHKVYEKMSLSVRRGETLTIIGGSGGGKSVCLKLMIGLLQPNAGSVRYGDVEVSTVSQAGLTAVRRDVAYVFQGGALFDSMNVLDNVGYALKEHTKMGDEEIRLRAAECLELVGLDTDLLLTMPANLSGGMKKRVALARSIALEPKVILYDEPTTGLDPKNIARIGGMIMKLQRELGVTSVVVTHDMPMAYKVSDRIAMLYERAFPFVDTADAMWSSDAPEVRDFIHGKIRGQRGVA